MKLPKEIRDKKDLVRSAKTRKCSIINCKENAIRSLSENAWKIYIEKAGLKYKENSNHRVYLCKAHYNKSNKFRKAQEKVFQKKGFLDNTLTMKKGKWEL
ncbi:MAG: hypothetical protein AMS24_04340 [Chlamydiae bacterium SM23_39]|nr:MAG: hypothetical protein AMS24_04340 [Chlamydiae bacterium SM23_39]